MVPDDAYVGANVVLHAGVRFGLGCHLEDGAVVGKRSRPGPGSAREAEPAALETVLGERTLVGSHSVVCVGVCRTSILFLFRMPASLVPATLQCSNGRAREGRILVTHDISTLVTFAFERVADGRPMPGVFATRSSGAIGSWSFPATSVGTTWAPGPR